MSARELAHALLANGPALVIAKATIILALASIAGWLASGASAARRHLLWLTALASCLWLVVSAPVVPALAVRTSALLPTAPSADGNRSTSAGPTSVAARTAAKSARMPRGADTGSAAAPRLRVGPGTALIAFWVLGCFALLARQAIAFAGAARLARRSRACDAASRGELAEACSEVGVQRPIRLAYSDEVRAPMTFGALRPIVLLPDAARSWSRACRRAVLIHEAAHVARGDWMAQTIGRLARDLFWFHPLAWRAYTHLRRDAERSADDWVLRAGVCPAEYARHLLGVARDAVPAEPGLAAVGILSTGDLERRLVAMFDASRSRAIITFPVRAVAASLAFAVVSPFAALHLAAPSRVQAAGRAPIATPPSERMKVASVVDVDGARRVALPPLHGAPSALARVDAETPPAAAALEEHASARPDFSGTWRQDTISGDVAESHVNDSLFIRQTASAISLEERGHTADVATYGPPVTIPFGGAGIRNFAISGADTAVLITSALWVGDTLVIDTHSGQGVSHTIERLRLSPDGNTLIAENLSTVGAGGARWRFGGPLTFVMRRIRE